MSPEEFTSAMKAIADRPPNKRGFVDTEVVHIDMDDLLVKVLRELGYGEGCDVFDGTEKWYE